jgi:hypothetical protein
MSRSSLLRTALAAALSLTVLVPAAAQAAEPTVWLCKPGLADNPCLQSLTTTVQLPGGRRTTEHTPATRGGRIDCFYVYPTVSEQTTINATLRRDPEIRAIALYQASRFAQHCRVYAPVYRQLTLGAIGRTAEVTDAQRALAYRDVRDAWREYLRTFNNGRGVVLIGHSQGTRQLRRLIAEEIDPRARERRRIVSALLLGGNVTVRPGSDVGGDFKQMRACRRIAQTGCVVAYSIFDEPPPADSRFGRAKAGLEVLCTNPATLLGKRSLSTYVRTTPFPGVIGALLTGLQGELPSAPTPWLKPAGVYAARCDDADGANVLRVRAVDGARNLNPAPNRTWGLHLADINLAVGDLVEISGRQAARWLDRSDQGRPARPRSRRP